MSEHRHEWVSLLDVNSSGLYCSVCFEEMTADRANALERVAEAVRVLYAMREWPGQSLHPDIIPATHAVVDALKALDAADA